MKSLNKVMLIGFVGGDPEVRFTTDQKAVANFSVATLEHWKDGDERKEATTWHRCQAWGKVGELAGGLLKKGSPVYVEGRLKSRTYTDKDGIERTVFEIIVDEFSALASKQETADEKQAPAPKKKAK
jgi:single-strand DNA-binding protein